MLPAELEEITDPPREEDELLTADELDTISLFSSLKKGGPDFRRFPSTTILRRCRRGRVICEQGESGSTAFYILTTEDVLKLRELQKQLVEETVQGKAEGKPEFELHPYFKSIPRANSRRKLAEVTQEIAELKQKLASLPPVESDLGPQREVAAAHLLVNMEGEKKRKGLLHRMLSTLTGGDQQKTPQYSREHSDRRPRRHQRPDSARTAARRRIAGRNELHESGSALSHGDRGKRLLHAGNAPQRAGHAAKR